MKAEIWAKDVDSGDFTMTIRTKIKGINEVDQEKRKQAKRRIKSITCLYISLKFEDVRGPESIVSGEEKKRIPRKK